MASSPITTTLSPLSNADSLAAFVSLPWQQRYPLQTSLALIQQAANDFGDDPALVFHALAERGEEPEVISFKALAHKVYQTANLLHTLGVEHKDTVTLLLPNLIETHLALWGSQAAGIANPINPLLENHHKAQIMNATRAKVLVTLSPTDAQQWQQLLALAAEVKSLETVLLVEQPNAAAPMDTGDLRVLNFNAQIATQPTEYLISGRKIDGDDIAAYFHTGGTTSHPKVACVKHLGIAFVAQIYQGLSAHKGRYNTLCGLPLFHIYGSVPGGMANILAGRAMIMMTAKGFRGTHSLTNWWHFIGRYQVPSFSAVPTILSALLNAPWEPDDIRCFKEVTSGAAPLAQQVKDDFEKTFDALVMEGYGMTESSGLLSRSFDLQSPKGAVGRPLPYMEMCIADVGDNSLKKVCPNNHIGQVLVRGPNIFSGYLKPQDNENAWVDNTWFNTGDLGFLNDQGYLTLTGRAKDLIIRGGHNIDPALIEEPLSNHPAVAMAIAIGQPDIYAGEIPIAYVTLKTNQHITAEALLEYCQQHISERAAIPKRIEFVDAMPLTAVSKIFKPALRNMAIEYAVTEQLQSQNIRASVRAYQDEKIGQMVELVLDDKTQHAQVASLLSQFFFTSHIH